MPYFPPVLLSPHCLLILILISFFFFSSAKVLRACERALLWDEAVYLYKEDGQYDSAVKTMIEHCVCFQHDLFLDCVKKVGRVCFFCDGLRFCLVCRARARDYIILYFFCCLDDSAIWWAC